MSIDIENQAQPQPQPIPQPPDKKSGRVIGGAILLVIGVVFLLQQLNVLYFAEWLFHWPTWLILWGLYIGGRHNFRNGGWLIMVLIGAVFLANDAIPDFDAWKFAWPSAIIIFGIWLIIRRNQPWNEEKWKRKWEKQNNKWNDKWDKYEYKYQYKYGKWGAQDPVVTPVTPVDPNNPAEPAAEATTSNVPPTFNTSKTYTGDDTLDTVSVFGNVVKTVFSKNFRGGDVVNIFGGTEIDLTQADINGRVIIDIVQIFGGSKIIVPSNWQVVSDTAAVFAGIDDKRIKAGVIQDPNKILVIKGVSIFAGIDIRSY
jgi:predicted membrane protein